MDSVGCAIPTILLAQGVKFQIFWATLGLVGALLMGAVLVLMVERWRKRPGTEGLTANDQLAHFRELRDKGTITQAEYERIRSQLAGDLRREMNVPPAPVPLPTTPATPTSPPVQNGSFFRETPPPESPASP